MMNEQSRSDYQENQTSLTMRQPMSPRSTAMMTLQMQLGLVTTLAASSRRFWLSFNLVQLCSTLSKFIRICLWMVSSPLLILMALQLSILMPSRILSILSSIRLSIFFKAYKIQRSSRVYSCSFSSSLSIWGLCILNSSRDQYLLLLRSLRVNSTCLLSFFTNLKQFFSKVYKIKVLYSSSFSKGLISSFFSSPQTQQYLFLSLFFLPGTYSRIIPFSFFTFSFSFSTKVAICRRFRSITYWESLIENSSFALSSRSDQSSIMLLEFSSS